MTSDFRMEFDPGAIKHLGLQMYSTLPPVIAELVANAWDAGAARVEVVVPTGHLDDESEIRVTDDGDGMSDSDIRERYLVVGRDRRAADGEDERKAPDRRLMGRKGIGKFAGFGIARIVEVESSTGDGSASRLLMDYADIDQAAKGRERALAFPSLEPTGEVTKGTRVILRNITKYRTRSIDLVGLRRGLARRFSILGNGFELIVNGDPITPDERDLKKLLDTDANGNRYLWEIDQEIQPDSGWRVRGWIGALDRTDKSSDGLSRGIAIMARGKLVQEPFVFEATVGQQYALSYLVGELHAEFVDEAEDTVGTARNSLVWDTPANSALLSWGALLVGKISREWAEKRSNDNQARLQENPQYKRFLEATEGIGKSRVKKVADKLIRDVVSRQIVDEDKTSGEVVDLCIDFLEFDAFWELAEDLNKTESTDSLGLLRLFREWEVVEAKEMARVTNGRIATIEKLTALIDENALEVPVLHNFLKEFPWVLDPRWNLVDDEVRYSELLRNKFPEADDVPDKDKRIDFMCVHEGSAFVIVEIKRPQSRVSTNELEQINEYVAFMRHHLKNASDPDLKRSQVVGYLLCGSVANGYKQEQRVRQLLQDGIYIRFYDQLLGMVTRSHKDFLERYRQLRDAKSGRS